LESKLDLGDETRSLATEVLNQWDCRIDTWTEDRYVISCSSLIRGRADDSRDTALSQGINLSGVRIAAIKNRHLGTLHLQKACCRFPA
jgi:hypothetical protein